jgi:hypothetical protein
MSESARINVKDKRHGTSNYRLSQKRSRFHSSFGHILTNGTAGDIPRFCQEKARAFKIWPLGMFFPGLRFICMKSILTLLTNKQKKQ